MPSSTNITMEKSGHLQLQPLQCPRCDSSNTKFCYYNNYSLAQPRHFCKACKRYWTRGGTLRNVPVGGGCRKNKRMMKRQAVEVATAATASFNFTGGSDGISSPAFSVTTNNNIVRSSDLDLSQSSNPGSNNPSFYPNPREIKFPFSMFNSIRVSSELGFSSGIGASEELQQINYENGVNQIHNFAITNSNSGSIHSSVDGNVNPVPPFRSSTFPSSTMASLLTSTFQQQNFISGDNLKHVQHGNNFRNLILPEDVEIMQPGKRVESTIEQMSTSPHVLWNTSGEWLDPSDLGSSVSSLI